MMNQEEKKAKIEYVKNQTLDLVDFKKNPDDDEVKGIIEDVVFQFAKDNYLSIEEKEEIIVAAFNSLRKLDVLQPLLEDDSITEVMINGPSSIFIEKSGVGVVEVDVQFESREKLDNVIQKIVGEVNRVVNEANPIVDARLLDGSRVNAVLPPIALNGPILTIRKFGKEPMTMDRLIHYGSLTPDVAELLKKMVQARYNIFVSGGTGSGKTTFLNALSNFIPEDERIITIEDSAELQIINVKNIAKMETRNKNVEGAGAITMMDLIKASLRMRPDRIVVGEVRGAEALDMLQAMNTGHDGSLSTGHSNSTKDMLSRLETMVLMAAPLPLEAIRSQISSALDIIIHLGRLRDKSRKVLEITEVLNYENGKIVLNPIFIFEEEGVTEKGKILGRLKYTGNKMQAVDKFKGAGIDFESLGEWFEGNRK